jgi:predicted RNA-binding protein with TRAM domain
LGTTLPHLNRLQSLIDKQDIIEGEIVNIGSKGDPITKASDGKTVIINGIKANKGDRVKYKITNPGPKVDFGKAVEINADFFYAIMNQDTLVRIQSYFDSVDTYFKSSSNKTDGTLKELLSSLENARALSIKLKPEEQVRINNRILANRKSILADYIINKAFDFIAKEEEEEIGKFFNGDERKLSMVLTTPGIFRHRSLQSLKNDLFIENKLKGYDDIVKGLENNLDSMDGALKLMEFKTKIEELEPQAKTYLSKMGELFTKLNKKSYLTIDTIVEANTTDINEIHKQIENAFSGRSLDIEFRKVFRSLNEFFSLRDAAIKLQACLGNTSYLQAESIFRPYLKQKVASIFET